MAEEHEALTPLVHWARYEPSDAQPWDLARVVHLHRRAAFAAPFDVLQQDLRDGPTAALDRLLAGEMTNRSGSGDFEKLAATIGAAAAASGNAGRLQAWWIYRMLRTPDPLGERLTLMWHNHFATSNRKVQDVERMYRQNVILRQHARAPLGQLLEAVVKDPALLAWLDADANRKGHPNENLARELMELFTLGIGHYTEEDVKQAARALTGWGIADDAFRFRPSRHDSGEKTVLGTRDALSGDDLLSLLLAHEATSRRIAWRICHTFMGDDALDDAALDELADGLAKRNLDIGWAIETVLRSARFFSDENLRSRIYGPVEYVVGTLCALEACDPPPSTLLLAEWSARMGQELFYPPNVGGWPEGRAWLSSKAIVARANFAASLVNGEIWYPSRMPALGELAGRYSQTNDPEACASWFATLLWGAAPADVLGEVVSAARDAPHDQFCSRAVALLLARPENQLA